MVISVIVPLYKGTRFLKKITSQLTAAAERLQGGAESLEVIFINDSPDDLVCESDFSVPFSVHCRNNSVNEGIQKARLQGLDMASGDYIHFLDQDDLIVPDYYCSQIEHIGDADAVYCRCYNGKRQVYTHERIFETAFDRNQLLSVCPVISPGQVLLKRSSIPDFWKTHILQNIGSDDYFLWLCMYAKGCRFACNQEILFTHSRNGKNFSCNILRIKSSDEEMKDFLIESEMFSSDDCKKIKEIPQKQLLRRYSPQMKDQVVLMVLSELLECMEHGITLDNFFKRRQISHIAIFGAAIMGERIRGLLLGSSVSVSFFIDRNAEFIEEEIPVYSLKEAPDRIDAILISNISGENQIQKQLVEKYDVPIYCIRDVAEAMQKEMTESYD